MNHATLTTEHVAGERVLVLDCKHATTRIAAIGQDTPGVPSISETLLVAMALMKHHDQEGCKCTAALRRRYRVTI